MRWEFDLDLGRALRDAAAGAALFGVVLLLAGDAWHIGSAAAADDAVLGSGLAWTDVPAGRADGGSVLALLRQAVGPAADLSRLAVLGAAFAVLFAFNLTVVRHLRRVYASPRRDGWRRGR